MRFWYSATPTAALSVIMAKRMKIPDVPHGGGQPLLRLECPGGDEPSPGGPHGGLQPRLHRARAAEPPGRGAPSTTHHRDRLARWLRFWRPIARAHRRLRRLTVDLGLDPRRVLPCQRAPRGERRHPRPARSLLGCLNTVEECGLRSWCPPTPVPASASTRCGRPVQRSATFHDPFGFPRLQPAAVTPHASCPTPAPSPRSRPCCGFPAVTLRSSIERPEALDTGVDPDDGPEPCCGDQCHPIRDGPPDRTGPTPGLHNREHLGTSRQLHPVDGSSAQAVVRAPLTFGEGDGKVAVASVGGQPPQHLSQTRRYTQWVAPAMFT